MFIPYSPKGEQNRTCSDEQIINAVQGYRHSFLTQTEAAEKYGISKSQLVYWDKKLPLHLELPMQVQGSQDYAKAMLLCVILNLIKGKGKRLNKGDT